MSNPFEYFGGPGSAIVQHDGKEPMFYQPGKDGVPLTREMILFKNAAEGGEYVDPDEPPFRVGYPVKGHDGVWRMFNAAGEIVLWTGGDPAKYIAENPIVRRRATMAEMARLFAAAFPEEAR